MALIEYKIIFKPKCERKIEKLEKIPEVNRALEAIYIGIRANPHKFGVVPPIAAIRYVKGDFEQEDGTKAQVVIMFTIIEDDRVVEVIDAYLLDGNRRRKDVSLN